MATMTLQQAFDQAAQLHQAGRLSEAEAVYRQILSMRPDHAGAIHLLGVIAHQVGQNETAVELIRQAIALNPDWPVAFNNLVEPLRLLGRRDEAIAAARQAIALREDFPEAHGSLALVLRESGRRHEAIAAYRHAIFYRAAYPEAHYNLGVCLNEAGQMDDAIAAYRQAIALNPNYAEALNNLGVCLVAQGKVDEAIAALGRAVAIRPDYAEAQFNLGNALKETGQLDGAIAAYRRAVAARPDYAEAHSNLVYAMHFHAGSNARAIGDELGRWNRQYAEPLMKLIQPHGNDRNADRVMRIGYVSPDFRDHVVGRNLLPLLRNHDHRQFHITCYAQGSADEMTTQFQKHADAWRDIVGLSDDQLAEQIRKDKIDILVDLALHMEGGRLAVFARKPAPVQATFAGYPGSTGLTAIDYRLSDPFLDPPGMDESVYSEKTVRLPASFWCYDPLDCGDIPVGPLPANTTGVVTFGCLNNFAKVSDPIMAVWAQVLTKVSGSRLLLLAGPGTHRQRTAGKFAGWGIDPSRIEFAAMQPRRNYLGLYHHIDIGLDTFPYNGHTTSLDSLWMGVPVITLIGQTPVSRAGFCQLSNIAIPQLAAKTPEQFVAIATKLAGELPRLGTLRANLRKRMEQSPLMDAKKFARDIEAVYRHMWAGWCEKGG